MPQRICSSSSAATTVLLWIPGCVRSFTKSTTARKDVTDKKIERHYKKFGAWKGLAIWCDMTERWFDGKL